jgi:hypothetical protein
LWENALKECVEKEREVFDMCMMEGCDRMSKMKRKKESCDEEKKECLGRKCKKVGEEVWELSKVVAYDEFRREQGLQSRKVLGMKGESREECVEAEKRKRVFCCEIGSKASHMVTVKNMDMDWKAVGWMHWRKAFAIPFIDNLLAKEAEELVSVEPETDMSGMKKKYLEYTIEKEGESGVLYGFPIHDLVMREIIERQVVGGPTVVRENMFFVEANGGGKEGNRPVCKRHMDPKIMKEISMESKGSHAEPIAMFIPIAGSFIVETFEQYKKHIGRPRRAKQHLVEVGDIFMLHWRQLHSIMLKIDPLSEKAKWIIFAAARKERHLMY